MCLGVKDLEPSLNQNGEKPYSNWLQGKGRLIEMILGIQDRRIRAKYKYLSDWTQEIRSYQFSLSYPQFFPSLFFDGLSLTTFFLKASTPSEGVQATCPRVLNPKGIT